MVQLCLDGMEISNKILKDSDTYTNDYSVVDHISIIGHHDIKMVQSAKLEVDGMFVKEIEVVRHYLLSMIHLKRPSVNLLKDNWKIVLSSEKKVEN